LNTAVGYKTGLNPSDEANGRYQIVADTYMTLIGYGATKDNLSTLTNGIAIGADAHVLQSNQAVLGNDNITTTLLKGSVGIGTTSPWAKLSVAGSAGGTVPLFTVSSSTSAFATSTVFNIDSNGFVGIGRESPVYTLDVLAQGTGVIARFQSANATGCTLATDGTISCTSDERMKKNIEDLTYGLETVTNLRPVLFNWNYEDGSTLKNLGFLAQDVELLIPKLVVTDKEGMKSLNTTGMIPILVKAVQEIWEKITPVLAWFNFHDDLLCVDDVCVTKEQFKNILLNAGVGATVINTEVTNAEDEEVIETATTTEEVTEETTVEETASTDSASSLQATPEVIEELPIPSEQDSDTESSIHDLPAEPTDSGQIGTEPVTPEPTPETLEP